MLENLLTRALAVLWHESEPKNGEGRTERRGIQAGAATAEG